MYSFVVCNCNGDMDLIMEKCTILSWYEAWFIHFEFKWRRTLSRIIDITKASGPNERDIKRDIDLKYKCVLRARGAWPDYMSHDKDMTCAFVDRGGQRHWL